MCGVVGVATVVGRELSVGPGGLAAMRDRLAHRGPDGMGLWWGGHVGLGHRRLAVVGVGEEGAQPAVSECGGHVLVYNGELYNDASVREELMAAGEGAWESGSDTGTVVRALARWGAAGLSRLRGMYALAWYDAGRKVLTLARDPLGIKPLVWARVRGAGGADEVVFGSEVGAVLGHPRVSARPDWGVVSAYLTTIRTTLGDRTLYEGVRVVRPGEVIEFDLSGTSAGGGVVERRGRVGAWMGGRGWDGGEDVVGAVRRCVSESVAAHLRSDVPVCALLSGGLDSTIVCAEAAGRVERLHTYCAGATVEGTGSPDFAFARLASERLGTTHRERVVTRGMFCERWAWMVDRLGQPLSTPNEVAIHEVASGLRGEGHVVALSGEGADELFGGYDRPLSAIAAWGRGAGPDVLEGGGEFVLDHAAWMPRASKGAMLRPAMWELVEEDAGLVEEYRRGFAGCVNDAAGWGGIGDEDRLLQAALLHQQRVNLVGLLGRLDGATMLAGVEGRTPLADVEVARMAGSLPMGMKLRSGGGVMGAATKIGLRRAYEGVVAGEILRREKASFPLPFQAWMGDALGVLAGNEFVESVFEAGAIDLVRADPARSWNLAWPMLNLAMWGRRWGG